MSETFAGPRTITKAILKVEVVDNVLNSGAFVHWDVIVNGVTIGDFTVVEGFTGPIQGTYAFPRIVGPSYDVTIAVTNEVPSGAGSHSLAYAGSFAHSIQLGSAAPGR